MSALRRIADSPAPWLILFALYAVTQSAIRVHFKTSFFGDDSELFLWARELAWGYGVQPPLYAWIQWGVNQIFGQGQVAMAAMRALCLFGIYTAGFLLARRFAPVRLAGLAALGLFLIPEIAQTFLRTRTHNLLVTALVPLACIAFLDLLERQRARDYALFGLLAGLAILAKATGAIFLLGLVIAAGAARETRRTIFSVKLALTGALALLILAGPSLWSIRNAELATASLEKFQPGGGWPTGLASLAWALWASGGFLAGSVGIAAVLTRRNAGAPLHIAVFWRAGAISLGLIALAVIATDSAEVKERWLVPIMAPLAPLALVWTLHRRGVMRYFPSVLGAVVAIGMLAALPGYFRKSEPPPRTDFAQLATAFRQTRAQTMLMRDDMAAGVALVAADLPVFQRVDRGPLPCAGPVLLAAWPEQDLSLDAFRARLSGCSDTPGPVQTFGAGNAQVTFVVLTLVPAP